MPLAALCEQQGKVPLPVLQRFPGFSVGFPKSWSVAGAVPCEGVALLGVVDVSWRAAGTAEL